MNNLPAYHCLARCIEAKDDCAAFNLDKENGVCELLSAHLCNHSGLELEPSDSFTYYDIYSEAATEVLTILMLFHLLRFVEKKKKELMC